MVTILGLLLLAWLLASAEILLPGGILGVLAVLTLAAASFFGYDSYGIAGSLLVFILGGALILVAVYLEFRIINHTRFRKSFVLGAAVTGKSSSVHASDDVIGKSAETLTAMAPTGMIRIKDQTYEAYSQSGMLSKGETVRVVGKDNFRLIIEKL